MTMRVAISCLLVSLCLLQPLQAQDKTAPEQKLDQLLRDLQKLPKSAWDARIKTIEARIAAHKKRAQDLRAQSEKMKAQAANEDQLASKLGASIAELKSMIALVKPAPMPVAAKKPAAPAKKPAPTPAVTKKPAATMKKPSPAPAATKKPAAPMKKPTPAPPKKTTPEVTKSAAALITWTDHIQAIAEEHCSVCHDADEASGDLDMSTYASMMQGGSSGTTILPGNPDGSRLYLLVAHLEKPLMPEDADKLPAALIENIRRWIELGAPENLTTAKASATRIATEQAAAAKAASVATPRPQVSATMPEKLASHKVLHSDLAQPVRTLTTSPHAPLLAVPGNGQILLYHSKTRKLLGALPFPFLQVEHLEFSQDGTRLLAAGGSPGSRGGAMTYDVRTGEILGNYGKEFDSVFAAAISPGMSLIALGGASKKVRVFVADTGERLYEITTHRDFILGLAFSPDGNYLASSDRSGMVSVWEADTGRNVHDLTGHRGAVTSVSFRADAKALSTSCLDGSIRTFELKDGKQTWTQRHNSPVLAVKWSSANLLASMGQNGEVRLWQTGGKDTGKRSRVNDWVYALGFDQKSETLFFGDWRGRIHVDVLATKGIEHALTPTAKPAAQQDS